MVSLVRPSLFVIVASVFNSFVVCTDKELFLSRKRRYLTFPEESTLQLVYDQIIGVVDFTNLFILGITCAMAWQLPHEPFDEDFLKNQFLNDDEPKRRIDENVTDTSVNDYPDRNYNSLDSSSWNEVFQSNKLSSSASWDDSTRKKFSYQKFRKPTKKHLAYAAIGKRSIPPTSKFDRFYTNHHRTTRHVIYKKIEKFLNARGVHGSDCLRKALCETSQRQGNEKPGSFVAEIMRVIFSLPVPNEDTVYHGPNERDYDMAHNASINCSEMYSKCKESLWNLDFV
ncbi:uncharacterized protein LOC119076131 [Bradysia coprophila]|uniref:uncharacterized protein LOC119076131 n=1 Tax=Bradysia coprophila TaxID=38358 RepID=UPI00187DB6ED|nr:uncharacterized protein LOC119076131 [Bradysia coprophila]